MEQGLKSKKNHEQNDHVPPFGSAAHDHEG